MNNPLDLPVAALAAAVQRGEVSPIELVEGALARIAATDGPLNAVVRVDDHGAHVAALRVAADLANGADLPLAGIPFAVKETEEVRGWRSTSGDPGASGRRPSDDDSAQVARLRAAGAIPVAATNPDLYGASAQTANPLFGTTRNPWDLSRIPGGSSGGSAVAVATRMVPFATGADGGGSIRIPAAACGVVGLRPSTGVIPDADATASPWSGLAVRAPMARSVADLAHILDEVCAPPAAGRTPASSPTGFVAAIADAGLRGLRVAWSPTLGYADPDPRILSCCADAVGLLAGAGAVVTEVESVLDVDPVDVFGVLAALAIAADVRVTRGNPSVDGLNPAVTACLQHAAGLATADIAAAHAARTRIRERFARLFERFDVLVTPTTAQLAPKVPHPDNEWVKFTHPFNLIDSPALSIPAGAVLESGRRLPVGVQLAGPRLSDRAVVAVAAALEAMLGLALTPPVAFRTSDGAIA